MAEGPKRESFLCLPGEGDFRPMPLPVGAGVRKGEMMERCNGEVLERLTELKGEVVRLRESLEPVELEERVLLREAPTGQRVLSLTMGNILALGLISGAVSFGLVEFVLWCTGR